MTLLNKKTGNVAYDTAANLLDKRRNQDNSNDNQNLVRFN